MKVLCTFLRDSHCYETNKNGMELMPTILVILGWRLFFYANEGNEPIHVHCRKGEMECKYWLNRENFDLDESFTYNMSPRDKRQIRKIIYEHFEYIEQQWDEFQRRRRQ